MIEHPPLPARLTVAALVHWQGRFLLVEEEIKGQRRFNQPAGHVEPGENLIEAACRELNDEAARLEQGKHREIGLQRFGLAVEDDLDHGVRGCAGAENLIMPAV